MATATTRVSVAREPQLLAQTVVVIGGSAGIGLETARLAHSEGAGVVLTARDLKRLEHVARELSAQSSAAFDADDAAAIKRFFDELPDAPYPTCPGTRRHCRARRSPHEQHRHHQGELRHRRGSTSH